MSWCRWSGRPGMDRRAHRRRTRPWRGGASVNTIVPKRNDPCRRPPAAAAVAHRRRWWWRAGRRSHFGESRNGPSTNQGSGDVPAVFFVHLEAGPVGRSRSGAGRRDVRGCRPADLHEVVSQRDGAVWKRFGTAGAVAGRPSFQSVKIGRGAVGVPVRECSKPGTERRRIGDRAMFRSRFLEIWWRGVSPSTRSRGGTGRLVEIRLGRSGWSEVATRRPSRSRLATGRGGVEAVRHRRAGRRSTEFPECEDRSRRGRCAGSGAFETGNGAATNR